MNRFQTGSKNDYNEYLLYFFICSFLGWTMETIYSYMVLGHFVNRGFLIGPICPIYGFGMLILVIWLSKYKKNYFKLFFVSAVILTIFEYTTSYCLDAFFKLKWWDYTNEFLNINGRISIYYTLVWGFISILVFKYIYPIIKKLTLFISKKMSYRAETYFLKILSVVFFIDVILSTIQYIN